MELIDRAPPAPELPGDLAFLLAGNLGPSPFTALDNDYFLRLVERAAPDLVQGLKQHAQNGYEIMRVLAAIGARCSVAATRLVQGSYIAWAELGTKATGEISLSRANNLNGAGVVKEGSLVIAQNRRRFRTQQDVAFGVNDLGPFSVGIESEGAGWDYNVHGETITAAGEILPGSIQEWARLVEDPPFWDPTITIRQVAPTIGGRAPMLEQLGDERSVTRQPGEPQEIFRTRIRQIPDTVSPLALMRGVWYTWHKAFGPTAAYWYIEPWEIDYQTVWDAPPNRIGRFDPTLFTYNDPRRPPKQVRFRNRWLSEDDAAGAVIIALPNLPCVDEMGWFYDDPALNEDDLSTPPHAGWRRQFNAFDTPAELLGVFDGYDVGRRSIYKGIFEVLQRLRAGGVPVSIELLESA